MDVNGNIAKGFDMIKDSVSLSIPLFLCIYFNRQKKTHESAIGIKGMGERWKNGRAPDR